MPSTALRIGNRVAYFRKAIKSPLFESDRVLVRDAFDFVSLWLKRNCPEALPFWKQSQDFHIASSRLPPQSSPLTSYYSLLNAAKTLLTVKGVTFREQHGVSGDRTKSKRALTNEEVTIHGSGVLAALVAYLGEPETANQHSMGAILSNLPFIHRAYRYTYQSHPEMFIPVRGLVYRSDPSKYVWVSADIEGRYSDRRSLKTLPAEFEVDEGFGDRRVVRTKRKLSWYSAKASNEDKDRALDRLHGYHQKVRIHFSFISGAPDLWYLKRRISGATTISRYNMTLIFAAMHRLSELARYDPGGLSSYFEGKENWLLTEFIQVAPSQFIDELVCEMTGLEFGIPGIRPRST